MTSHLQGFSYDHHHIPKIGVLLVNLGTPQAATTKELRRYLGEFLWDYRVTETPRALWWLILHGIILRKRPAHSAKAYQRVWTAEGSPLLCISRAQARGLQTALRARYPAPVHVALGMRYGKPSIADALEELRENQAQQIVILPLYPQYASPTTGSTFDAVAQVLTRWRWIPDLRFISHYHDHPSYINALAQEIKSYWQRHGQGDRLLFSYHGIPKRFFLAGDPYHCECHKTSRRVAEALQLLPEQWEVCFQSRFGREEWLTPYTDERVKTLAKEGVPRIDVVCPGFSADCLETLAEINEENRAYFMENGGRYFHYIPALNSTPLHIRALTDIVLNHLQGLMTKEASILSTEADARMARMQQLKNRG
jgi:protoporphyrin/coproporphyrin ferrochelatase